MSSSKSLQCQRSTLKWGSRVLSWNINWASGLNCLYSNSTLQTLTLKSTFGIANIYLNTWHLTILPPFMGPNLTKLTPLEQFHHIPIGMYGVVSLLWGSQYIPLGLGWHCSNGTRLVKMSFQTPHGGLNNLQFCHKVVGDTSPYMLTKIGLSCNC